MAGALYSKRSDSLTAFSLIEVVLALGLFAFAIAGLLGVMTLSMDSNREADEYSTVTNLQSSLMAELRARPFHSPLETGLRLYDAEGNRTSDTAAAHFRCSMREVPPPALFATTIPEPAAAIVRVLRLEWEWPANATQKRFLAGSLVLTNPSPLTGP